jgi:NAD(P)-dependent dehydrogenase (short-subunit alcohol dehydrogenase family)
MRAAPAFPRDCTIPASTRLSKYTVVLRSEFSHSDFAAERSCAGLNEALQKNSYRTNLPVYESILFNNAGVLRNQHALGEPGLAQEALEQFNTNALGPLRVTGAVLPMLRKAASESKRKVKVANMSSRMGSVADNSSGGFYGYRASKAAENMISVNMAKDLEKDNILSLCLHPGYVSTRMVGHKGDIDPDKCAELLVKLVDNASSREDGHKFWHRDGSVLPW